MDMCPVYVILETSIRSMTNNYIKQLEEREQYREQVKKESIAKEME